MIEDTKNTEPPVAGRRVDAVVLRYFVYTGEQFEMVETREEARRMADDAIDDWRDCCDPEWPEEVTNVCWGEICGQCIEEVTEDADDPSKTYYSYSISADDDRFERVRAAAIYEIEKIIDHCRDQEGWRMKAIREAAQRIESSFID